MTAKTVSDHEGEITNNDNYMDKPIKAPDRLPLKGGWGVFITGNKRQDYPRPNGKFSVIVD